MREIAIIGAGQSGLQLAIALKRKNFNVSVFSNRLPDQIRTGRILSSQGMFHTALTIERALGIDLWELKSPQNTVMTFILADPITYSPIIQWQSLLPPYQSIDQRIKIPEWMEIFQNDGGNLIIKDVDISDLYQISQSHDLTIVSAGKSEICQLFKINEQESPFKTPQRMLSCIYVNNVIPQNPPGVRGNIIPGIGEFFVMPGLTMDGNCEMMLFEGIPNGPFDCWKDVKDIEDQFRIGLNLLEKFVPWEAIRFRHAKPTDQNANLLGSYAPTVRQPTAQLSNGKTIFGLGDAIVLNDPIAGQGANNACKAAQIYAESICENSSRIYDEAWMKKTFQKYWSDHGRWATKWSNLLLTPPPPHIIELLKAATNNPSIARKLADGFDNPSTLFPWILDPSATLDMITPKRTLAFN